MLEKKSHIESRKIQEKRIIHEIHASIAIRCSPRELSKRYAEAKSHLERVLQLLFCLYNSIYSLFNGDFYFFLCSFQLDNFCFEFFFHLILFKFCYVSACYSYFPLFLSILFTLRYHAFVLSRFYLLLVFSSFSTLFSSYSPCFLFWFENFPCFYFQFANFPCFSHNFVSSRVFPRIFLFFEAFFSIVPQFPSSKFFVCAVFFISSVFSTCFNVKLHLNLREKKELDLFAASLLRQMTIL